MNAMRAPSYDLFKLIVAILLLILALILMWVSPPQSPEPTATPINSGQRPEASPTTVPTSATSPPLTVTSVSLPSPTVTNVSVLTATSPPSSTPTPITQLRATPIAAGPIIRAVCDAAASRSHLQVGMSAILLRCLNFRSSPGIGSNWLLTNKPGTKVEVIGGPECVPHFTGLTYGGRSNYQMDALAGPRKALCMGHSILWTRPSRQDYVRLPSSGRSAASLTYIVNSPKNFNTI